MVAARPSNLSVVRFTDLVSLPAIPAINRWAIFNRPLNADWGKDSLSEPYRDEGIRAVVNRCKLLCEPGLTKYPCYYAHSQMNTDYGRIGVSMKTKRIVVVPSIAILLLAVLSVVNAQTTRSATPTKP